MFVSFDPVHPCDFSAFAAFLVIVYMKRQNFSEGPKTSENFQELLRSQTHHLSPAAFFSNLNSGPPYGYISRVETQTWFEGPNVLTLSLRILLANGEFLFAEQTLAGQICFLANYRTPLVLIIVSCRVVSLWTFRDIYDPKCRIHAFQVIYGPKYEEVQVI